MRPIFVSGAFDDIRSGQVRFLEEASKRGPLTVLLRDDESSGAILRRTPGFGFEERRYFLSSLRWVDRVSTLGRECPADALPDIARPGSVWAILGEGSGLAPEEECANPEKLRFCAERGIEAMVPGPGGLEGFRHDYPPPGIVVEAGKPRVVTTGSFDWLHTGHVRFFEEAAALGELTVVVGHDANIRHLKGEGHPLVPEDERRYLAGSIRSVARAMISSGTGWLDAEPEIALIDPDRYVVNADGDRPEKRSFCEERGIEYIVLSREPRPGLPRRSSTDLRGF